MKLSELNLTFYPSTSLRTSFLSRTLLRKCGTEFIPHTCRAGLVLLVSLLTCLFLSGCSFEYYFNEGITSRNPEKKIKYFAKALEKWKDSDGKNNKANTLSNRGSVYGSLNLTDKAIDDFTEAIKYNKLDSQLYYNRGLVYSRQKKFKYSLADFNTAVKLNPDFKEAYLARGDTYKKIGQAEKSKRDFLKAGKLAQTDVLYNQGVKYFQTKNYTEAVNCFSKSINSNPDSKESYNMRGLAYIHKGNPAKALSDFNKAIKIDPEFADAYNNRGTIYAADNERTNDAVKDFKKALLLKNKDPQAYYNLGFTYVKAKQYDDAIKYFNMSEEMSAAALNPEVYYQRGMAYYHKERYKNAITDFSKVLKLLPDNADAYLFRGLSYEKIGKNKESNADLTCAIRLNPQFSK